MQPLTLRPSSGMHHGVLLLQRVKSLRSNQPRHATIGCVLRLIPKYTSITASADSVTRSPLYSIYGETIAGVTVIRAFGASSVFLREMLRCVDTNACPFVQSLLIIIGYH